MCCVTIRRCVWYVISSSTVLGITVSRNFKESGAIFSRIKVGWGVIAIL
ncbi:MAG: hypothetical protein NE330_07640 [Lentisphaeraceae bacterium]|nr:hypothetical protein [Lentisphaeraceae bacterium]